MTIVLTMGMPKNYDLVCSGGCDSAEQQLRATPHPRSGAAERRYLTYKVSSSSCALLMWERLRAGGEGDARG